MHQPTAVASLSDHALLAHVEALVARERRATAELIASLCELDERRLYLGVGCSSLFAYCTEVLHLSEHAAYGRIEAARCARKFPRILERLADGSLTLTAISLLAPVMTEENAGVLLDRARHTSKREVEHLVAEVRPLPAVAATVRKLPQSPRLPHAVSDALLPPQPAGEPLARTAPHVSQPATIRPLTPEIYKVQFTLSREGYEHLRRAQDLLRHSLPSGDAGRIFERALSVLVCELERRKHAVTERPRTERPANGHGRHIPAAVKRKVWRRDGGRCAFVGTRGRCTSRSLLEYHHVIPFAEGGDTSAANLQLRCRAHNQHEARLWFEAELGLDRVDARRAPSPSATPVAPVARSP
ncbi:MAG: HNH endonuclease [Vicinamibacterales bacterium]|nr:HNH endonuclease [Vicinamibacterales bacterium]